ncbi:Galactoside O-acetyltransferase [Fundidesulfovibrio magnetotacticus]|uniref:Galactoside O-acetyltransferase n=1 Tax=Fundidesulfovibrio magnetotacticus TaxID=2730080 RepID=A0A6V8LMZ2_9BACT|nr:acyltransferase [Fundidesulfovibrio magnetotacticus]GFK94042.1 Galactoside O-acetyltransferase [Fundidesulfovibrio magnetotacticus]
MPQWFTTKLRQAAEALDNIDDPEAVLDVLGILEAPPMELNSVARMQLYAETLPKAQEFPLTPGQRHLHFLWDYFDRLPLSLIVPFSIPFRRMVARKLFGACGTAFMAEENVRFNFGRLLSVGDNVFINRNTFLDTKGGVTLGNGVALAEDVRIITHTHGESSHIEREYRPVVIQEYAKVYSGAMIFPGVTVGRQAIVAAGALVTHDVPDNMVAAGRPAKVLRERRTEGKEGEALDHIWLF